MGAASRSAAVAVLAFRPMGTSSRSRRASSTSGDQREQAILDTAEKLLSERSLRRITVEDLARGAGISRPTFYFYFASKEAVLLALVDRVVAEMRLKTDPLLERLADDPAGGWEEAIRGVWEAWRAHRALMSAASEAGSASPEVREVWERVMGDFVELCARAIERERERGAAPASDVSPRELATALNWMNERMLYVTFSGVRPAVGEEKLVPVLVGTWMSAIYGRR